MGATTPEQVHGLWEQAFSSADIPALLSLYEPTAVLALSSDELVAGRAAIGQAVDRFLALKPAFKMKPLRSVHADDLAILYSSWELVGSAPDGSEVLMSGITSDVVRRQPDGTWLIAIDNPFGGAQSDEVSNVP
jgi:ketosteroid isomerase-like protein